MPFTARKDQMPDLRPRSELRLAETTSLTPEVTQRTEWARQVWMAVDSLDLEQRNLILLSYRRGFDQDRIATHLAMPPNTVSRIIASGMQQLAQILVDPNPDPNSVLPG